MEGADASVIGVDVALTQITIAVLDADGRVRVIPNAEGHDRTPASVHFYEADGAVVGEEALKVCELEPDTTVLDVPTLLGEDTVVTLFGKDWSPQELVALVLRKVREDAEAIRGHDISHAAFAVPGFFDSAMRAALAEAAAIAGWQVAAVLPTATAAIVGATGAALRPASRILVLDVRERSVECTLVQRAEDTLAVLDVESAIGIGMGSLRRALRTRIAARWWAEIGVDPEAAPVTQQLLRTLTQDALLAAGRNGRVTCHLGTGSDRQVYSWERESFVEESWPLLVDLVRPALRLLKRAGPAGRPDHVMMVGEGSRTPGLRRAVAVLLGVDPLRHDGWLDAAGRGAAWLGTARLQPHHPGLQPQLVVPHVLKASSAVKEVGPAHTDQPHRATLGLADGGEVRAVRVREVTTLTLGMLVLQADRTERVVELIPAGTPLPARFRGRFVYAYDNMTSVRVEVTEGRGNTREQVRVIGAVALTGLPPRPRGTPIEVTYLYGEDQILAVEVTDLHSGKAVKADLVFRGALSADHREAARSRASVTHVG